MTTIVIDFEGKRIFSDRQTTCCAGKKCFIGDNPDIRRYYETNIKVQPLQNGVYLTGAGCVSSILQQVDYINRYGYVGKPTGDMTIALVRSKGQGLFVDYYTTIRSFSWWRGYYYTWEHEAIQKSEGFLSFGSGGRYAAGALQAGCTREKAMKVASELDIFTGCDIDITEVNNVH